MTAGREIEASETFRVSVPASLWAWSPNMDCPGIYAGRGTCGNVKVGYSLNARRRLRDLRLQPVALIPFRRGLNTTPREPYLLAETLRRLESAIHDELADLAVAREWFRDDGRIP